MIQLPATAIHPSCRCRDQTAPRTIDMGPTTKKADGSEASPHPQAEDPARAPMAPGVCRPTRETPMWCGPPRIRRRTASHRTAPRRATADQPPRQHPTQRSRGTPHMTGQHPPRIAGKGERDSRPAGRGYGVIFMCAHTGTGLSHQSRPHNRGYARAGGCLTLWPATGRGSSPTGADDASSPSARLCRLSNASACPMATQLRRGLAEHRGVPACAWAITSGLHETGAPLSMRRAAVR